MVEYLWDSVVQSPWSSKLTDLGLWFMLALCMSLGFGCCWVFLWWVLPTSWLTEGHSVPHLLFSVVHLWVGCVGAGSSVCTWFWGISLALVPLFVLFLHFLVVFLDRSWVGLVWLLPSPSPSSVLSCWWFLCRWVSFFRRYPGVHSFYLLFFVIGWRRKAKWFKTAGVYSMIFKVPALREEIGVTLDIYSVNHDNSPT